MYTCYSYHIRPWSSHIKYVQGLKGNYVSIERTDVKKSS